MTSEETAKQEAENLRLSWMVDQAHMAAEEIVRHYVKRVTIMFVLLFLCILGAVGLNQHTNADSRDSIVDSGTAVSIAGCNRDFTTTNTLRQQIKINTARQDQLEASGVLSHGLAKAGREANAELLAKYRLPDCRIAAKTLTANPDHKPLTQEPRYPGDPQSQVEAAELKRSIEQGGNVP